jgi:hypothetical protein
MVTIQRGYPATRIEVSEIKRFEKVVAESRVVSLEILDPEGRVKGPKIALNKLGNS